jgi:beta-fructofuranosidase
MLRLPDHWAWDLWTVGDGTDQHMFFLRASRALLDPGRRHRRAGIGHAVSADLRSWRVLADALVHADAPAWDDQAIWTGSVVPGPDGRWRMFYTGVSRTGADLGQRIGLARSDDLLRWQRAGPGPLLDADPRWYDTHPDGSSDCWRDPFVFADPAGDGWHMLVAARARSGPAGGSGVIGYAHSPDLETWTVGPPLTAPAGFHHLEVPQAYVLDGQPVLVFSCQPDHVPAGLARAGCWTCPGETLLGPWDVSAAAPFDDDPALYCGRLVAIDRDRWVLLGFHHGDNDEAFTGEIVDPIAVTWENSRLISADGPADS